MALKTEETQPNSLSADKLIELMFTVGAHYGYKKSRRHPSVSPYIFGLKNRVEIFDLEKTSALVDVAKGFVRNLAGSGKQMLIVGTKFEAREAVQDAVGEISQPFVINRWIGGTLTNLSEIRRRVARFEELLEQRETGEMTKYTKKERLLLSREIETLEKNFGGIVGLKDLPGAIFVVDVREEHTAVREAKRLSIPIIGLANSDCDLSGIDYPMVGNDASRGSIKYFVKEIADAYNEGAKSRVAEPTVKDVS